MRTSTGELALQSNCGGTLRQNIPHDVPVHVRQAKIPPLEAVCEFLVVDPEEM